MLRRINTEFEGLNRSITVYSKDRLMHWLTCTNNEQYIFMSSFSKKDYFIQKDILYKVWADLSK